MRKKRNPEKGSPSSWNQRIPIIILAAVATLIASYMGLYQCHLIDSAWDPVFGDETQKVLDSDVSHMLRKWFIIPDAFLGAIAYGLDILLGFVGSQRRWRDSPWLVVLFGISVIPVGLVSATLVFLQGTVVGSWCFLCLITAAISLILIPLSYNEVAASVRYLYQVRKKSKNPKIFWKAFWGHSS